MVQSLMLEAQFDTIQLINPGFEDEPKASSVPFGWENCGPRGQTPPDVHPTGTFGVTHEPFRGNSYVGMVVRSDGTNESIGQFLYSPLVKGQCYKFGIRLARSEDYYSPDPPQPSSQRYTTPILLRIWGGSKACKKEELLAFSPSIIDSDWKYYDFVFSPKKDNYSFFILEAYYDVPVIKPYNGNILLDEATNIIHMNCD